MKKTDEKLKSDLEETYTQKTEVTYDLINDIGWYKANNEIFYQQCCNVLKLLPLYKLEKIFELSQIDPYSKDSLEKLQSKDTPYHERIKILQLQEMGVVEYTTKLNI